MAHSTENLDVVSNIKKAIVYFGLNTKNPFWLRCPIRVAFNASFPSGKIKPPWAYNLN